MLSEPYSVMTYRMFVNQWPELCFLAHDADGTLCGAIVCKAEPRKRSSHAPANADEEAAAAAVAAAEGARGALQGYVAMLAVNTAVRRGGIGSRLAKLALDKMKETCCEVVLETEVTNTGALRLYQRLGFSRTRRLAKYYLNGVDALRLKLWWPRPGPEDTADVADTDAG